MGLISRVSSRTYRENMFGARKLVAAGMRRGLATTAPAMGAFPKNGGLTHDQRVKAWCDYFDHDECDYWYFRHAARKCVGDDWIPPPEVVQSMLYNCRKNNCYPSAIRVVELVKMRCMNNRKAYNWLMQELQPTFDDLGMKTPKNSDSTTTSRSSIPHKHLQLCLFILWPRTANHS